MKRNLYAVVSITHVEGERAADELAESLTGRTVYVLPVARHDEKCRKGADHAHAQYDGATFCPSCGKYISVRIAKTS